MKHTVATLEKLCASGCAVPGCTCGKEVLDALVMCCRACMEAKHKSQPEVRLISGLRLARIICGTCGRDIADVAVSRACSERVDAEAKQRRRRGTCACQSLCVVYRRGTGHLEMCCAKCGEVFDTLEVALVP